MQKSDVFFLICTVVSVLLCRTAQAASKDGSGRVSAFALDFPARGALAPQPPARGVFHGTYRTVATWSPKNPIVAWRAIRISRGVPVTMS